MIDGVIQFLQNLGPEIMARTYEHIYLTVVALAIAVAIALPLGILLTRCKIKAVVSTVMGGAGVIQTIPALALIALMVVILYALGELFDFLTIPSIGVFPAVVALVLYALLPILRNTYTSINQVDPTIKEVARGMGMTRFQILFQVELPMSLPVIVAGIRISTVWTIGIATLAGLIGAGGLGDLIIKGLRNFNMELLVAGTIPAAMLALVFDGLISVVEKWLTPEGLKIEDRAQ